MSATPGTGMLVHSAQQQAAERLREAVHALQSHIDALPALLDQVVGSVPGWETSPADKWNSTLPAFLQSLSTTHVARYGAEVPNIQRLCELRLFAVSAGRFKPSARTLLLESPVELLASKRADLNEAIDTFLLLALRAYDAEHERPLLGSAT